MTTISIHDVRQLAMLSALELSEAELASLTDDVANILTYVEDLERLDTEGVEPTYQVTDLSNVMRDDVAAPSPVGQQGLLDLAPSRQGSSIKVPKVL